MHRLIKWPVLCGLLGVWLVQAASGQAVNYYINDAVTNVSVNIDATNFVNNNSFSTISLTPYETTDTQNYTNNGTMSGFGGFLFDTLSGGFRSTASSFFNPGNITVSSYSSFIPSGSNSVAITASGVVTVNATNIVNSGTMNVGLNGGILLSGQNLNLSRGTLAMGQTSLTGTQFGVGGTGSFGNNTNANWDPSTALTATNATSSSPNVFTASPSLSYFDIKSPTTNNTIIRAVFIQNLNTNVPYSVYFNSAGTGLGSGAATIGWSGTVLNPATGEVTTNYLYLNNDYLLGASTNVTLINGIPSNFTVTTQGGQNAGLPAATLTSVDGLTNFPSGAMTNKYSYANIQLSATSVEPNTPTAGNPTGAITNMPSRIQITADRELNLAMATITGQNYLSLTCTNQFDGAAGATIVSPYTDMNLGVTNGFITVSNLVQSVVPNWVGSIQAWSTEFSYVSTNSGSSVSNDCRVLIISSYLLPSTSPMVQNLKLHGTNLVISDELNLMNDPSIDAQSVTLTANTGYPNVGAGSPYGALNLESGNAFSTTTSIPNLLWLTNNGAISMFNVGNFGGPAPANLLSFVNNGPLFDQGSSIYANYFQNSSSIYNGSGNFNLLALSSVLNGGYIMANGDISITSGSLVASNLMMQAGRSLTLQVTNLLTDNGNGSGNYWSVGAGSSVGLNLPVLPAAGDLLGTTIYEVASASKNVVNTWAGQDRGNSLSGFVNNAALGTLILNGASVPPYSQFTFNPAGTANAMYVNQLVLTNKAATLNFGTSNVTSLAISPGMVIYYAAASSNGVSVASTINGWNNNQLRWVPGFDSTNILVQPSASLANGFQYNVSGVWIPGLSGLATGTNYQVIVQSTTNLSSPNWANVYTGTPPFTLTNLGYTNYPQQFYRAKQGW